MLAMNRHYPSIRHDLLNNDYAVMHHKSVANHEFSIMEPLTGQAFTMMKQYHFARNDNISHDYPYQMPVINQ